jgi:hypothetical protein
MASSSRQKTTMAKLTRERALRERRELKQAKKDARRRAAAEARVSESSQDPQQRGTDHDDDAVEPAAERPESSAPIAAASSVSPDRAP